MVSGAGAYDDEEALMEGKLQLKCAEPVLLTRETCNTAAKSYQWGTLRASPTMPNTSAQNFIVGRNVKIPAPTDAYPSSQYSRTPKTYCIWSHIPTAAMSSQSFPTLCWSHTFIPLSWPCRASLCSENGSRTPQRTPSTTSAHCRQQSLRLLVMFYSRDGAG